MSLVVRRIEDARQLRTAYLVGCARSGEAVIFDPPRDADRCIEVAAREGLRIAAVAETHVHADFLSGARELSERTGAVALVSAAGGAAWTPRWVNRYAHRLIRHDDTHDIGGVRLQAMHVPGASPEQLIYLVYDHSAGAEEPVGAVVGDFLSLEGLMRNEHASGSPVAIAAERRAVHLWQESIERFLTLSDLVQVWPLRPVRRAVANSGGLPQSTVGYERRYGFLAQIMNDTPAFASAVTEGCRESDGCCARIRATNLEGVSLLARMPNPYILTSLDERPELLDASICTVIDTRAWTVFRSGHLSGAIHAPQGKYLATTVGAFVEPDERVVLVCDPNHAQELVRECVRVGIDRVEAVLPPALLHKQRQRLQSAPEVGVEGAVLALTTGEVHVIDVRDGTECARGMIAGALRVPPSRLVQRAPDFAGAKVIVHCSLGSQSATAASVLRRHGVDAVNLAGGYEAWRRADLPVVVPGGFDADPACSLGLAPAVRAAV
jgi:hydroxyacylglutathione hydrolase